MKRGPLTWMVPWCSRLEIWDPNFINISPQFFNSMSSHKKLGRNNVSLLRRHGGGEGAHDCKTLSVMKKDFQIVFVRCQLL